MQTGGAAIRPFQLYPQSYCFPELEGGKSPNRYAGAGKPGLEFFLNGGMNRSRRFHGLAGVSEYYVVMQPFLHDVNISNVRCGIGDIMYILIYTISCRFPGLPRQ